MKNGSAGVKEKYSTGRKRPKNGGNSNGKRVLFESDDFFHLIAENSSDLVFHIKYYPTHHLAYVSPSSVRITGYTPEEYYADGELALKSVYPEDRELHREFREIDDFSRNEPVILRWIHKDGHIIWTEQTKSVIHDEQGNKREVFFTCRDITQRKHAEDALRESQRFTASLMDNAPHTTMVINPDTSIRYVNRAWEELNGWKLSEIIGIKAPYPWWPDEDKDVLLEGFHEAIKQDHGQGEVIAQKKNGEQYWIDMNWEVVSYDGEQQYFLINSIDITRRKKLEQLQTDENRVLTLLAQGADLQELLDEIVRLGEANDQSIKGSILLLDPNTGLLMLRSAPSFSDDCLSLYENGISMKQGAGSCGTAAYLKQRVIVPDMKNSPFFRAKNVVKTATENGLHACWSQPIISSEGEILGTIGNYCNRVGEPSEDNLSILEWSARIAAIAIEHKRAEENLANEAIRRRILIEQSSDGIVILDQDGHIYEASQKFCEMLGYTVEEASKLSVWDWEYQYSREQVARMVQSIDEAGDHFETRHRRKDGSVYDVEISTNGAIVAGQKLIFCVCRDITERKRAEEALKESEEKYRSVVENANSGIIVIQDGEVVFNNHWVLQILGYKLEENSSFDFISKIHPEDLPLVLKRIKERLSGVPATDSIEVRVITNSGEVKWIETRSVKIQWDNKPAVQAFILDITDRKQALEALRESQEKFSAAFHSSPDLVTIVNLNEKKYTEVNDSFLQVTGYTREEIVGRSNEELNMWVYPEEEAKMGQLLEENGDFRHEEYHFRMKSGEIRTWLCSADIVNIGGEPSMLAVATDITERKKAQEALKESEERFSKAFHGSPESISISRLKDGRFIEVNDSFLRDKGFTREEVIGKNTIELGIAHRNKERESLYEGLKIHGPVHNRPYKYLTKSGELRYGYMSADIISLGNEPCVIAQSTDITEQKRTEDRLRLLGSITQKVSDATIVTDLEFRITYINQAAQDLLGYSIDEVRDKKLGIFNAAPIPAGHLKKILSVLSSGKVWSGTVTKKKKDGSTIICESKLSPLLDDSGDVISYIDILRDVTKQKETEAKLKIQKQLNERILATMPEGVIVVNDDNDHIILANKAFKNMFQLNMKTGQYKSLYEIGHKEQLRQNYNTVKQGEAESRTLEFRHNLNDIEKVISCNIIRMDGGQTLFTFTDISKEREEEEKLYLTDRLASIGEMAAGLAHELNNPLTGVLALSQLLIDSDIQEEYKEDLQCVFDEARRAADIVKNVLLFTRNNNYENGQASVNEVVNNILRLREYEEKVSNITVISELQEDLPDIAIDKFQLQQLFLNIVLNAEAAIKDTGKAGKITVKTERTNNHVNIFFKDNGCGIKKNVLPRIFDPFFTTKDIGKGTGLGLSICYGIVVKHGGRISVKSKLNEGSTFTIRMPIASIKETQERA